MTIKDILCILAITTSVMCVFVLIRNNRGYDRLMDIVSGMLKNLGKVAEDVVQMQADIANLYDLGKENLEKAEKSVKGLARRFEEINVRLKALEKDFSELPVDDLIKSNEAEKLWNDGLQSIISYGQDIAKLNKEAIKRG